MVCWFNSLTWRYDFCANTCNYIWRNICCKLASFLKCDEMEAWEVQRLAADLTRDKPKISTLLANETEEYRSSSMKPLGHKAVKRFIYYPWKCTFVFFRVLSSLLGTAQETPHLRGSRGVRHACGKRTSVWIVLPPITGPAFKRPLKRLWSWSGIQRDRSENEGPSKAGTSA